MTARRVYYNSACPVCRAGVANQRGKMDKAGVGCDIEWLDINAAPDALAPRGVTIDDVRRKLYVEDERGTLHVGADAFAALWRETPGRTGLARLLAAPGFAAAARWLYDRFADLLYAWNRRKGRW
jgi:predicted DCC family thiol-disulfide oxidoreductase YuxK